MADNNSREDLVRSFRVVTGVDEERATFFLQSAAWNMDVRTLMDAHISCLAVYFTLLFVCRLL